MLVKNVFSCDSGVDFLEQLYDFMTTPIAQGGAGYYAVMDGRNENPPYVIFSDSNSPTPNAVNGGLTGLPPKIIWVKITSSTEITLRFYSAYNTTTNFCGGQFGGYRFTIPSSGIFAVKVVVSNELFLLLTRVSTTYQWACLDEFSSFNINEFPYLEPTSVYGITQSSINSGSNVAVQLGTGEASRFSLGRCYYLYDFSGDQNNANYTYLTDIDTVNDIVTLNYVNTTYNIGSVLCSYLHRFCAISNMSYDEVYYSNIGAASDFSIPFSNAINCPKYNIVYNNVYSIKNSCVIFSPTYYGRICPEENQGIVFYRKPIIYTNQAYYYGSTVFTRSKIFFYPNNIITGDNLNTTLYMDGIKLNDNRYYVRYGNQLYILDKE